MNVIIHLDEVFLKGKNQGFFLKKFSSNIERLFKGAVAKRMEGGFVIENIDENELDRLGGVPGIAKYAPVVECDRDLDSIKKALEKFEFAKDVESFRVTTRRSDKSYKLSSMEINADVGSFLNVKYGWKVSLKKFDLNVHIDIGSKQAWVYIDMADGVGGLPTGSSGRIMCLLSGGIDSPVAAYTMMKRGSEVTLVHFQNETQVTDEVSEKITDLAKVLARYQPKVKLIIVPFADFQKEIVMKVPADYRMILSRRIMFKIAENLAKREKCLALTTGDSLGQVASQTLENMIAIYDATNLLKVTPLIGMNKREITDIARKIGTLKISERPYEDCCSLFVAKHPKTNAQLDDVLKIEENLELGDLSAVRGEVFVF